MNKWEVMGHAFEGIGMLLLTECENMAVNCSVDPGFEQIYEHYAIMLRTLTTQHALIQDAFGMLEAQFSQAVDAELKANRSHYIGVKPKKEVG